MSSPLDDRLSCDHLAGEFASNNARFGELRGEVERRARDNVGLLLMGPLAAATFIDTGTTQRTETEALERRNERLRDLMRQRSCPGAS
ncbi:hypothetical protein ACE7GA_07910 [Roseomonas sp. CCTCC AB2023176]|uniref:hypothetical protein n=1 Tax=Roseomonas sp. CCTCC AB2023176 TaxID=3342640 RepID=UPI0035DEB565